jgi:competence protein ComEC
VKPAATAVDLRLVPAALAGWLITWLGLTVSPAVSFWLAAAAGAGTVAAFVAPWRGGPALALALGCIAAAAVAVGVRVAARDASPLVGLARDRQDARLRVVVAEDPQPIAGGPGGQRRVALATRVSEARAGERSWRLSGRVLVLAPAAGWGRLLPSQHVTVEGRLLPPLAGDLTVAAISARGPPHDVGPPSLVQRAAERLRAGLRRAAQRLPDGPRGLLPGLVVGDVSRLDPSLEADFRTTGLTHLVAVSGANCAIVAGAVLVLLRAVRIGPRTSAVAAGLALLGFVVLARPSPSVLRAAAMGGLALVALATGRTRAGLPALAATVLGLVLVSPDLARSAGFAMSVVATGALLLVAPVWSAALVARGVPPLAAQALAVPAAAHLATAPLIAAVSGRVSLVAIPANLLAAPAVAPATVLGVLAAVAAPLSGAVAGALAWLAGWPVRWIVGVAEHGAGVPDAALGWPAGARGAVLLALLLYGGALLARSRSARRAALAATLGAALIAVPVRVVAPGWPPPGWLFVACDVGQGDGLMLHAGPGAAVVVDTGPDPALADGCLRRLHVDRIPLLVITHLHADHVGGLSGALRGRRLGAIVTGPLDEPAPAWHDLLGAAASRGVTVGQPSVGRTWQIGAVQLQVLGPEIAYHGTRSDPNNSSLVLRARIGGHTVLLAGDAEIAAQRALLRSGLDLRADVLKVPHHGSAYSDSEFLAAVRARVGVISVGAGNDYGLPARVLLSALDGLGMRVLRTDRDGDVAFCVQQGRLVVVTHTPAGLPR